MSAYDTFSHPYDRPRWITDTLLEQTRQLWAKRFGRPVETDEAVGILIRMSKLLSLLIPNRVARPRADDVRA